MAAKTKPLRGRSELIKADGTVVPVRDYDGTLCMPADEWAACKAQIAGNLSKTVSDLLLAHPTMRRSIGMAEGQQHATVRLSDLLRPTQRRQSTKYRVETVGEHDFTVGRYVNGQWEEHSRFARRTPARAKVEELNNTPAYQKRCKEQGT